MSIHQSAQSFLGRYSKAHRTLNAVHAAALVLSLHHLHASMFQTGPHVVFIEIRVPFIDRLSAQEPNAA